MDAIVLIAMTCDEVSAVRFLLEHFDSYPPPEESFFSLEDDYRVREAFRMATQADFCYYTEGKKRVAVEHYSGTHIYPMPRSSAEHAKARLEYELMRRYSRGNRGPEDHKCTVIYETALQEINNALSTDYSIFYTSTNG